MANLQYYLVLAFVFVVFLGKSSTQIMLQPAALSRVHKMPLFCLTGKRSTFCAVCC